MSHDYFVPFPLQFFLDDTNKSKLQIHFVVYYELTYELLDLFVF
jgi:hypothetical protein